jgi:hypothetical protein
MKKMKKSNMKNNLAKKYYFNYKELHFYGYTYNRNIEN